MASRLVRYIQDTRREMAHVSWPTRTQTISFTIMVVLVSIFIAFYSSAFDVLFTSGLRTTLDHAPRMNQPVSTSNVSATATTSTPNVTITPITGATSTQ